MLIGVTVHFVWWLLTAPIGGCRINVAGKCFFQVLRLQHAVKVAHMIRLACRNDQRELSKMSCIERLQQSVSAPFTVAPTQAQSMGHDECKRLLSPGFVVHPVVLHLETD